MDDLFARGEITAVFAPPTVLAKLVQGTRHQRIDGVKCVFYGTATLQPALYRAAAALFGPVIRVTYGKSEMFNPITVLEMREAAEYYRDLETLDAVCLGSPATNVEVEMGITEDGLFVPYTVPGDVVRVIREGARGHVQGIVAPGPSRAEPVCSRWCPPRNTRPPACRLPGVLRRYG